MEMKIYKPDEIPHNIRKQLQGLHIVWGHLYKAVMNSSNPSDRAIVLLEGDYVLGWGFVAFPQIPIVCYYVLRRKVSFMLYVRRSERRKGYGRKIHKKAMTLFRRWRSNKPSRNKNKLVVFASKDISYNFFNDVKCKDMKIDTD